MQLSRHSMVRWFIPGLAALCLFGAGCKQPDSSGGSTSGGADTKGGTAPVATDAAKQDTSGDTIKIGHYASLTGETSTFGTQTDEGVKFAVDELNAKGGVLGKKIEVETQDDQSKADEAKTVVTKFAADPKIAAVIGEVASTRSLNAAPVLQRAGIPMVSPSSTNVNVTKVGDYIFRVCYIDPFQGYVCAKFASEELKAKTAGIMRNPSEDYSVGLADVFKSEFEGMGGKIAADVSYSSKDSDFRSQLGRLKDVNVIFVPGYYGELGTIARQAREMGITAPLLGGDGWDSPDLIKGAGGPGKALEGSYFSTHYSPGDSSERVQTFVKAFKAKHNGVAPASNVSLGYDAMMLIADAMTRAKSTERSKVRDELAQTKNYKAVTGDITIDADRNATKSAVVLQIKGNDFVFAKSISPKTGDSTNSGTSASSSPASPSPAATTAATK